MATISRKISCKLCGFKGVVEAHDTKDYPSSKIFKMLGKDSKGFLHFLCPSCQADGTYSPSEFISPVPKIIGFVVLAIILWAIYRFVFR